MLLTGTFARALDDKLRLAIPKLLRDAIGHPQNSVIYIAPGTDGSLALYTEDVFSKLADHLALAPPTGEDVRAFSRLFYAQAQPAEIDRQGRLRIPPELAQWAGIDKDVVLLGVRDHLELWSAAAWQNYLQDKQAHYDEIAEKALGGSPPKANLNAPPSDAPTARPMQPR
jgi:MraZ protein